MSIHRPRHLMPSMLECGFTPRIPNSPIGVLSLCSLSLIALMLASPGVERQIIHDELHTTVLGSVLFPLVYDSVSDNADRITLMAILCKHFGTLAPRFKVEPTSLVLVESADGETEASHALPSLSLLQLHVRAKSPGKSASVNVSHHLFLPSFSAWIVAL